ncbi:hypothetical protein DER46DRAFT_119098 [Fusarium sp. MPI-SDFR-AT-0072]|nr:hypothetical protein DER46DRAFT_119098 [Fusarium sp. MPI-SDFR-AT-0072]
MNLMQVRLSGSHITDFSFGFHLLQFSLFVFYLSLSVFKRDSVLHIWPPSWQERGRMPTSRSFLNVLLLLDCALCSTSFSSSTHSSSSIFSPAFFTLDLLHRFLPSFHLSTECTRQRPFSSPAAPPLPTSTIPRKSHTQQPPTTNHSKFCHIPLGREIINPFLSNLISKPPKTLQFYGSI